MKMKGRPILERFNKISSEQLYLRTHLWKVRPTELWELEQGFPAVATAFGEGPIKKAKPQNQSGRCLPRKALLLGFPVTWEILLQVAPL